MKKIFQFNCDCGRSGELDGIFVADHEEVENLIGKGIYFGEVLGKHSEIYGVLEEDEIKVISDDQEFIEKFEEIMGSGTISGFNPLDFYHPDEEDDD